MKQKGVPTLKQGSGEPFHFEDLVAAYLSVEMLSNSVSFALNQLTIVRIERSATDWEPFGDMLVTVRNEQREKVEVGGSIKETRIITGAGAKPALRDDIWDVFQKRKLGVESGHLALFTQRLGQRANDLVQSLLEQSRGVSPSRLDEKIQHENLRTFHDSFRPQKSSNSSDSFLPGAALGCFHLRQFDFNESHSTDAERAVQLCDNLLDQKFSNSRKGKDLWKRLVDIALDCRLRGGEINVAKIVALLSTDFHLKDYPNDKNALQALRAESEIAKTRVRSILPGAISITRKTLVEEVEGALGPSNVAVIVGKSGAGKSAIAKMVSATWEQEFGEAIWIRAPKANSLLEEQGLLAAVDRKSGESSLLVVDSLERCNGEEDIEAVIRLLKAARRWRIIVTSIDEFWTNQISIHRIGLDDSIQFQRIECSDFSDDELNEVRDKLPSSLSHLTRDSSLKKILCSPKRLEIVLRNLPPKNQKLLTEADLVDWWWRSEIRGQLSFSPEENAVKRLANHLADHLVYDVDPVFFSGSEEVIARLIDRGTLYRDLNGRIGFDHDILADWARYCHLKSQSDLSFICERLEYPTWLRALRLFSQSLCESDSSKWAESLKGWLSENSSVKGQAQLQIADAWIDGFLDSRAIVEIPNAIVTVLFRNNCEGIERLLVRLMMYSSIPDPTAEDRGRDFGIELSQSELETIRLPYFPIWKEVLKFLPQHQDQLTSEIPDTLARVGVMWVRYVEIIGESSFSFFWRDFAEVLILNAEKEFLREVSGDFRSKSKIARNFGDSNGSKLIYQAALAVSAQSPQRMIQLSRRASGLEKISDEIMPQNAGDRWKGIHRDYSRSIGSLVEPKPNSSPDLWPGGPCVCGSHDFFQAWMLFNTGATKLLKIDPQAVRNITFALIVEWPKSSLEGAPWVAQDHYGFRFDADNRKECFWTDGPFLPFLRADRESGITLIVDLINFATDRYAEWWPYDEKVEEFSLVGDWGVSLVKGNYQVFGWGIVGTNLADLLVSSLVSLEKWFEEQLEQDIDITGSVCQLLASSRSLAFVGVLISLGKNNPNLFKGVLRPLLFERDFYMLDLQINSGVLGLRSYSFSPEYQLKLHQAWNSRTSRKNTISNLCQRWLLEDEDFEKILGEVSECWRNKSNEHEEGSENWLIWQRWACNFDRSLWKRTIDDQGREFWINKRPEELNDHREMEAQSIKQELLTLPYHCQEFLDEGRQPELGELNAILEKLKNWDQYREACWKAHEESEDSSSILDDRNSRMGLLTILLRFGKSWLSDDQEKLRYLDEEIIKIIGNPPDMSFYSNFDRSSDYESFLAQAIPHRLVLNGLKGFEEYDAFFLGGAGSMVAKRRYYSVELFFKEVYRCREALGELVDRIQGLVVDLAKADISSRFPYEENSEGEFEIWFEKKIPQFVNGAAFMFTSFLPQKTVGYRVTKGDGIRRGRPYGLDIHRLFTAFVCLPNLELLDASRRERAITFVDEILSLFFEKHFLHRETSEERRRSEIRTDGFDDIFKLSARYFWDLSDWEQRKRLLQPWLTLPLESESIMANYIGKLLSEAMVRDPVPESDIIETWPKVVGEFSQLPWLSEGSGTNFDYEKVWKNLLIFGSVSSQWIKGVEFSPLCESLSDRYQMFAQEISYNERMQAQLILFLLQPAGTSCLSLVLEELGKHWKDASRYFWERATKLSAFEKLLQYLFTETKTGGLRESQYIEVFRSLLIGLATTGSQSALEIQNKVGKNTI